MADPLYPEPPFVMSNEDIVPAADTIAVTAAPTLISPEVISASIVPVCYSHLTLPTKG